MRNIDHTVFMRSALEQARQALEEGEFPVGCVLVHRGTIIADGRRAGSGRRPPNELSHAEIVALRNLSRLAPDMAREEISLYSTMEPCMMCLGAVMLNRIGTVVWAYEDVMGGAAGFPRRHLTPLYRDSPLRIIGPVLREESLALFRAFFSRPDNAYWRGSLLARYTLQQPCPAAGGAN